MNTHLEMSINQTCWLRFATLLILKIHLKICQQRLLVWGRFFVTFVVSPVWLYSKWILPEVSYIARTVAFKLQLIGLLGKILTLREAIYTKEMQKDLFIFLNITFFDHRKLLSYYRFVFNWVNDLIKLVQVRNILWIFNDFLCQLKEFIRYLDLTSPRFKSLLNVLCLLLTVFLRGKYILKLLANIFQLFQ